MKRVILRTILRASACVCLPVLATLAPARAQTNAPRAEEDCGEIERNHELVKAEALTSLFAQKGWLGAPLAELGIKVAFTPIGIFIAMAAPLIVEPAGRASDAAPLLPPAAAAATWRRCRG